LFVKSGPEDIDFTALAGGEIFDTAQVQSGLEFAIEAIDIVRDPEVWDGYVELTLTVADASGKTATDTVKMRVSPVMTFHHLLPPETVWVSDTGSPGNADMRLGLGQACKDASIPAPEALSVNDQWTQDFFETGYMSMPDPTGQHVMHVNYRSANVL